VAFLILYTSIKSLDTEQKEAAAIDGANPFQMFFFITLPHRTRSLASDRILTIKGCGISFNIDKNRSIQYRCTISIDASRKVLHQSVH
jgi:ABC-type sugar transport system permease subunit